MQAVIHLLAEVEKKPAPWTGASFNYEKELRLNVL
jgi:hypothetical protein